MSFSESSLQKKFQELNQSQQSVQTVSLWLIHHRKHAGTIVPSWLRELVGTPNSERKLTLIYLANDILQNSRKKGTEYSDEFAKVLQAAIENTSRHADKKLRFTLERILNIWHDRRIYSDEAINAYKKALHAVVPAADSNDQPSPLELTVVQKVTPPRPTKPIETTVESSNAVTTSSVEASSSVPKAAAQTQLSLREEVARELAAQTQKIEAPEPSELIGLLQELEKSASSDAVVREKIAQLPAQVSDINAPKALKDRAEALQLASTVNDALSLLDGYNTRLQQELVSRKQTALMLAVFLRQQQQEAEAEQRLLDEWSRRLKQVHAVKHELQVHLQSLPDLSSIEEKAVLKPLPTVNDLFGTN